MTSHVQMIEHAVIKFSSGREGLATRICAFGGCIPCAPQRPSPTNLLAGSNDMDPEFNGAKDHALQPVHLPKPADACMR